ncbi:MAG: Stk1 family PASTA domain-containing Ser/Thr kinase [Lachnospiraceae bacterium]|jgi:serine/threonine protein kinase|nr:Stk1 family PASTA domain-containing Ser/Thr kinase [Lachnospiraceae bacterium]
MLRPGMYLQERYEIMEQIGTGGMADVYKATCHTLNRLVAIKVLKEEFSRNEEFVNRFKMEAQAAARLSHPNIVNVFDVVDDGDIHYIVMELIEGITLKSYIAKKGFLEVKETIGIAIQMAQGMAAAHQQNIIHRDIKPQNIIISKDGKVKVADFGIARAACTNSQESDAIGSVHYISPEQATGDSVDARSDIYSLGITMFEMITGRLPFDGENTVMVAMAHLKAPIASPKESNPDIPESLEEIILTCTEKKPENRYDTAEEVIADLRKALINPYDGMFVPFVRKERQKKLEGEAKGEEALTQEEKESSIQHKEGNQKETGFGLDDFEGRWEELEPKDSEPNSGTKQRPAARYDITRQLERIFAAAGVVAAIIIVAVLLIVVIRLGGMFRFGSANIDPSEEKREESQVAEVTTAAIADSQVIMPNLLTKPLPMTENQARKLLEDSGLKMIVSSVENSNEIPAGYVMAQEYPEGTTLEKNTTVNVKVSKGSGTIALDELGLIGMEQQAAFALLVERRLVVSLTEEFSDIIPAGSVISYDPVNPKEGETVTLQISKGPSHALVPDVTNLTPGEAEAALIAAGFIPVAAGEENSETVDAGRVFGQSAQPDLPYLKGQPIQYYISLGPSETIIGVTHYVASIDKQYNLSMDLGPGSSSTSVQIVIRLRQEVNGKTVLKNLVEPRKVVGDTMIPISFSRIEGADGVEEGVVELVDLDQNKILASYPVSFFKTED